MTAKAIKEMFKLSSTITTQQHDIFVRQKASCCLPYRVFHRRNNDSIAIRVRANHKEDCAQPTITVEQKEFRYDGSDNNSPLLARYLQVTNKDTDISMQEHNTILQTYSGGKDFGARKGVSSMGLNVYSGSRGKFSKTRPSLDKTPKQTKTTL